MKRVSSRITDRTPDNKRTVPLSLAGWILVLSSGTFFLLDPRIRDPFLSVRQLFLSLLAAGLLYGVFIRGRRVIALDRPWGTLTFAFSLVFLGWSLLCASQSDNFSEGLLLVVRQGVFLILLFLFTGLLSQYRQALPLLGRIVTVVLLLQALTGILQQTGLALTGLPGDPHPTGFSGNRNLFGSLIVLQMPLAVWVGWRDRRAWKVLAAAALTAGLIALLLSQTRSAWLAFLAGILVADLALLARRRVFAPAVWRTLRLAHFAGAALIILAAGSMAGGLFGKQLSTSLKDRFQSLYQPAAVAERVAGRNMEERRYVWAHTLEMIAEHPVMGVGPGNWRIRFPQYGGATSLDVSEIDKLRVQPHNIYLQAASETGLPGLLLFLLAGLAPVMAILSSLRRPGLDGTAAGTLIILLAGLTSLSADMMFSFPLERAEHNLLAMLYLALGLVHYQPAPARKPLLIHPASPPLGLGLLAILAFSAFLSLEKWKVDYYLVKCIKADGKGNPREVIDLAEKGRSSWVTLGPVNDPLELFAGRAYTQLAQPEDALRVLQPALRYHPYNHRMYNTIGYAYLTAGKWEAAITPLKKALSFSPAYEPALVNLALSYFRMGAYDQCLALEKEIKLDDKPDLEDFFHKARLQKELGALQANPLLNAVLFVQKQIDEGKRQINAGPLFQVRDQAGSDSAFIRAYFDFADQYLVFNARQGGRPAEELERLRRRCEQAREFCLTRFPRRVVAERIITSNHRLMAEKFVSDTSVGAWRTLDDLFVPVR